MIVLGLRRELFWLVPSLVIGRVHPDVGGLCAQRARLRFGRAIDLELRAQGKTYIKLVNNIIIHLTHIKFIK